MEKINWNQFYCFYMVAKHLSMTEAAQVLGVSKPTVTEQIQRLEASLGFPLFTRRVRLIWLTEQGKRLLRHADDMFKVGDKVLKEIVEIKYERK